jgi:cell division protein FtsL
MKRATRRKWLDLDRRTFLAALAVVALIAMVAVMYLLVVSRTAGQGRRIQSLRSAVAEQERENSHLEVEIARASSAHRLIERAIDLGLAPVTFDQLWFVRDAESDDEASTREAHD